MFKFGKKSKKQIDTCHKDLQLILNTAISISRIDFGVSEGHRPISLQQKYFKEGKSTIDGITEFGKHNVFPSKAVDIYGYVKRKANYDPLVLSYLAGLLVTVAAMLKMQGLIEHELRWGGNWDRDGEILTDQDFDDLVHFELI